jgi:hypothetical protein
MKKFIIKIFIIVLCLLFIINLDRIILWGDYNFGNSPKFTFQDNKNSHNTSVIKYNNDLFVDGNLCLLINFSQKSKEKKIGYIKGDFWGSIIFGTYILYTYKDDVYNNFIIQKRSASQDIMRYYISLDTILALYDTPLEKINGKEINGISINDLIDQEIEIEIEFQDKLYKNLYLQENFSFIENIYFYNCVYLVNNELYIQKFSIEDYKVHYYSVKSEFYDLFL